MKKNIYSDIIYKEKSICLVLSYSRRKVFVTKRNICCGLIHEEKYL